MSPRIEAYVVLYAQDRSVASFSFAPGRIRTSDPRIRSPPLCPLSYGRLEREYSSLESVSLQVVRQTQGLSRTLAVILRQRRYWSSRRNCGSADALRRH